METPQYNFSGQQRRRIRTSYAGGSTAREIAEQLITENGVGYQEAVSASQIKAFIQDLYGGLFSEKIREEIRSACKSRRGPRFIASRINSLLGGKRVTEEEVQRYIQEGDNFLEGESSRKPESQSDSDLQPTGDAGPGGDIPSKIRRYHAEPQKKSKGSQRLSEFFSSSEWRVDGEEY